MRQRNQTKKAILYARVSTDEQKENGFSLQEQTSRLKKQAEQDGYTEFISIQEHHSAKDFNRPEFQSILSQLKSKEIHSDRIYVTKMDRFSRNAMEAINVVNQLTELGVEVYSINEGSLNFKDSSKYFPLLIHAGAAEHENLLRADNTMRGMRQALREGRWCWNAPFGYVNNKLNKLVEIHPTNAQFVQSAFEMMSKGVYSSEEVRNILTKKGMKKMGKQSFLNILRNGFYHGEIVIKKWKDEQEEVVRGIHKPIISKELFDSVQDVLNGKKKKYTSHKILIPELALRGHLLCPKCGGSITGSGSRSRNGDIYHYYHCQDSSHGRFRADQANEAFIDLLSSLEIPNEVLSLYYMVLEDIFKQDDEERDREIREMEYKMKNVEQKFKSLSDKMLSNEISTGTFNEIKKNLDKEKGDYMERISDLRSVSSSFQTYLNYGMPFLANMGAYYAGAEANVKSKIVGSIFPEKLIFSENKYRTGRPNQLLALLTQNINELEGTKNKKAGKKSGLSTLAPPVGLEPTTL